MKVSFIKLKIVESSLRSNFTWEYITLASFVAFQLQGFNFSFVLEFQIAIIATSHTVFKSKRGGLEEFSKTDCTVDFNSAISRESKKQSSTKLVSTFISPEYSGFIFLMIVMILSKTFEEISALDLNVDLCKSLIDHLITLGSLWFATVSYQHKPER